MKNKKLLIVILLFSMNFSAFHAFAITLLDKNYCSVTEYVDEISHASEHHQDGDVCQVHHLFHVPFILSQDKIFLSEIKNSNLPLEVNTKYDFSYLHNFLKPPILLV